MRGQGKAEVPMTVNELQATDAPSGQLVMPLGMMTLQAGMLGFSDSCSQYRCEYLVPPSETPLK